MTTKNRNSQELETDAEREIRYQEEIAYEQLVCLCGDYANHIMTPRILADRRRRAGDAAASPSDYDCRCPLRRDDEPPICQERRNDCKFAYRKCVQSDVSFGETGRRGKVWHDVHAAERKRILSTLPTDSDESFIAEIRRMETALKKEHARLLRMGARGIVRATSAWIA